MANSLRLCAFLHCVTAAPPPKVGGRAVAYYMLTTVMAVILGIILVTTIRPGGGKEADDIKGVSVCVCGGGEGGNSDITGSSPDLCRLSEFNCSATTTTTTSLAN